ncbi:MAG: hypothetical protein R6T85_12515 [Egibacteraceae bacterium]
MPVRWLVVLLAFAVMTSACGADDTTAPDGGTADPESSGDSAQRFPDVIDAELTATGDGDYEIAVTISSPYDTPERYADGWRVLTADGEVLAEHDLAHDHAGEQPFTRTRGPFAIPGGVDEVIVEGRDLEHGYGGETTTVEVAR